jgi:acyl-CoA synthetase (AMP-forming)/AMP-acid ligase II
MNTDTITSIIRTQAALGDRPLLVVDKIRITYAEAEFRSRRIASALLGAGAGRGSHVAMLLGNGSDFAASFLAIARIGAIAMPFSTMSTAQEIRGLLRGSDAEFLISATSYRGRDLKQTVFEAIGAPVQESLSQPQARLLLPQLPVLRRAWFGISELELSGQTEDARVGAAEAEVVPADILLIVHTSGSTSAPKGVLHTHGQVIRNMRRQNALRGYTGDERLLSNSPFFWIGGLAYSFISTLIAGACLICSSAEPEAMLDLLEAEQPTMCNGVASTVLNLTRHPSFPRRNLSSLRRGNLYPIMPENLRPADPELRYNLLGMTETGSVSLYGDGDMDLPDNKRGSFGKPVEGIEARIVDTETGEDASEGEFWVRGPNIMQGYYGRERWQCFDAQGWFHTGDMMRIDIDGDFYFKGRSGDIIRTAGAQVSPREVEGAISEITGGRMSIVIGVPDPERGQAITAVIIGEAPFDAEELKLELRKRLSPYKVPRHFVAMLENQLPTVSSGKIDLKKLVKIVCGEC